MVGGKDPPQVSGDFLTKCWLLLICFMLESVLGNIMLEPLNMTSPQLVLIFSCHDALQTKS